MRGCACRALLAVLAVSVAVLLCQLAMGQGTPTKPAAAPAPAKTAGPTSQPLLKIADLIFSWALDKEALPGSMWRTYEVWSTDVCRTAAGQLVRIDPTDPLQTQNAEGAWVDMGYLTSKSPLRVKPTTTMRSSALPPEGWQQAPFDDRDWAVGPGRVRQIYRGLSLVCLRGRFDVNDPAGVKKLNLSLAFHGGAVVYLNGQEIARVSLPEGKLALDTLALDYPKDAYFGPDGAAIPTFDWYTGVLERQGYRSNPLVGSRVRTLTVEVPTAGLRKGVNVLAVEVHRSPGDEAMYIASNASYGFFFAGRAARWWNRCQVDALTLAAEMEPGAVPSTDRPLGAAVANVTLPADQRQLKTAG